MDWLPSACSLLPSREYSVGYRNISHCVELLGFKSCLYITINIWAKIEKDKYCMESFICEVFFFFLIEFIEHANRMVSTSGWGESGRNGEILVKEYKLLVIR